MSASITLSDLSWSTPDGRAVFTGLNLVFGNERAGLVGRNGTGKTTILRLICGDLTPRSGAVSICGRVGWLRQEPATGGEETVADLFGISSALALIARAQAGLADAGQLAAIDWSLPARVDSALRRCGLDIAAEARLSRLSGGQRSRARLAALIFSEPDFLLLDEPTDNLDQNGRDMVGALLRDWRGGAIVVSHDRALLEEMDAIVELTTLGATRYGGNYSAYKTRKAEELDAAHRVLADAQKNRDDIEKRARQAAERKARKDSSGRRAHARGGQPRIVLDAWKGRAESSGGTDIRLRDSRMAAAGEALAAAREKIEILQPLRMDIGSTHLAAGKPVLRLDAVSGGHDPALPVIRDLSLAITGPERIAISGANGSGKTTLVAMIAGQIRPQTGKVELYVPMALIDQHVGILDPGLSLRDNFLRLNPDADENSCRAALARFRFRADEALQKAGILSGGQKLRAGLACVLGRPQPPALMMLDEPTNHLDLDATEALEAALCAYDGALVVVSHDTVFLNRIGIERHLKLR